MKKNCYIFWDEENVYIQCEDCHVKNNKGFRWEKNLLYGKHEIKCSLCHTMIYSRKKDEKNTAI